MRFTFVLPPRSFLLVGYLPRCIYVYPLPTAHTFFYTHHFWITCIAFTAFFVALRFTLRCSLRFLRYSIYIALRCILPGRILRYIALRYLLPLVALRSILPLPHTYVPVLLVVIFPRDDACAHDRYDGMTCALACACIAFCCAV